MNQISRPQPPEMGERQARMQQMVSDLLNEALRQGATAAEAGVSYDQGLSLTVRMGEVETVEHTRDNGLGVTVYFGRRKGSASTSDLTLGAIEETVKSACNIARYTSGDDCAGLADPELMATEFPELDLYHPWGIEVDAAAEMAGRCEAAARDLDRRISNSEGASVDTHQGLQVYGNTHGFIGGYLSSRHSLSCSVIARDRDSMQRDYWYTLDRRSERLEAPDQVGRRAAERSLARLGARKLSTRQAPVIFQADVATSLLHSFISAIRGSSLYRRASFLLDQLGETVFPGFVHIHEMPLLRGGLASAAFDGEGVATRNRDLVSGGVLQSYVLDTYSACKLGMRSTGNAGGVRNLRIDSGSFTREQLLQQMETGLLVTEMMGHGVNPVTGDYSRGASGFWVEAGQIQFPVEEITIAGNLKQMFTQLLAVGSDVETRGSVHTGSWLIENMTIAGD